AAAPAAAPESSKGTGDQSASPISSSTKGEQGDNTSAFSPVPPANTGTSAPASSGTAGGSANVSPGAAAGTSSASQGAVPAATGGSGPAPGGAPSGTTTTGAGAQNLRTSGGQATSTAPGLSAVSGGTPSGLSALSGVSPASSTLPENTSLEALLRQARDAYEKNQYAAALDLLNQMYDSYPAGTDEALWLMGQIFETQGPQRDIKKAYDAYKRLLEEFPTSSRYDEAQRRMRYIERFYFNIR
ncbi:MAG: tetratricopeptide repeat protein, partial [Breznakiellaceae bacterium]